MSRVVRRDLGIGCLTLAGVLSAMSMSAGNAFAERVPARITESRTTTSQLSAYHQVAKVVRTRTKGKLRASFYAEPQLLDKNAIALVRIQSVAKNGSIERFRCVAIHDIAECLGAPVKINYLPMDTKLVLEVELIPRELNALPQYVASLN